MQDYLPILPGLRSITFIYRARQGLGNVCKVGIGWNVQPSRSPLDDPELARYLMPTSQELTEQLL